MSGPYEKKTTGTRPELPENPAAKGKWFFVAKSTIRGMTTHSVWRERHHIKRVCTDKLGRRSAMHHRDRGGIAHLSELKLHIGGFALLVELRCSSLSGCSGFHKNAARFTFGAGFLEKFQAF